MCSMWVSRAAMALGSGEPAKLLQSQGGCQDSDPSSEPSSFASLMG
eukprot:CAMPEP_0178443988 /NCGR_PEP_ID=MMETSP0689_2-20121128/39229_1 /TAXON_ID=160604 /ORGANISM="Amphidinium massartii, Strain CS-259" /LENGTH=45 /DNA_ID= /DNA_START= /DNA_END= /DNA_ORIENTATION=